MVRGKATSRTIHTLTVLLATTILSACVSNGTGTEDGVDASTNFACEEFRQIASEADLLTGQELRDRVKAMWEDYASVSEEPRVYRAARAMLSTLTSGRLAGWARALGRMDAACTALGL
jgi:hypothetical protein